MVVVYLPLLYSRWLLNQNMEDGMNYTQHTVLKEFKELFLNFKNVSK